MFEWLSRKRRIPSALLTAIAAHQEGGVSREDCEACSSGCCSRGGFAILENVLEIFRLYSHGELFREDYIFTPGLKFSEFVRKYFDIWMEEIEGREDPLMCFHVRSLGPVGEPIGVPPVGGYWETRSQLFDRNPWLSRGCVFLSKAVPDWPIDDRQGNRQCILHSLSSDTHITAKPIDCVFHTCDRPYKARVPSADESDRWFRALADAFPHSRRRFERLMGKPGAVRREGEAGEE